jgi:DNA processing protein
LYLPALIKKTLTKDQLYYTLALLGTDGIGDVLAKKLIVHCGSAQAVLTEKKHHLAKIPGIGTGLIDALKNGKHQQKAEKEIDFIDKNGIQYTYFQDPDYPSYLKHCFDAPVLLFKKGNIDLKGKKIISIVGTRQMTNYGRSFLDTLIEELKEFDPVIVSGLAYGVDIYAHKTAMKHGLQTIGVLAHGLDTVYPAIHKKYVAEMLLNGGILSDYWSNTKPDKENFVKRNRIVAGISQATLVIESAEKGGSLITADIANSYNRDVFAVPGRITDVYSNGCNKLIKTNKASVLTSAKDIAYILNWEKQQSNQKSIQKQLFVELNEIEKKVYDYLIQEGKQELDTIALHCNLPIYKIATLLLQLELKGVVKPLPGKIFEAV